MRHILILISAVIFSGCAIVPAKAQPAQTTDLTADIKRLEEEQRRTGERVGEVRALIESDSLERLHTLLQEIIDTQRVLADATAEIKRVQGEFKITLANSEDRMTAKISNAAQWKNSQTIGVGASGVGIVGLGALAMRKKRSS